MAYITYQEYLAMGFSEMDETEFDKILPHAEAVLDSITRAFYRYVNIDDDLSFRAEMFKKAVGAQVGYFNDMGTTSSYGTYQAQSITIGRTSVSGAYGGGINVGGVSVSPEVFMYLKNTGLLYAGVCTR